MAVFEDGWFRVCHHSWRAGYDEGGVAGGLVAVVREWTRKCLPAWAAGGALALLAVFVAGPTIVPYIQPMSSFYDLRTVKVEDTVPGVAPRMLVDRAIKRDFRGRFEIEIMRAEGSEFSVYWECGEHDSDWRAYRKDAVLPDDLDLDWWMGIPPNRPCPLPPGTYKIISTIYARGWLNAELKTTVDSNVFNVRFHPVREAIVP